MFYSEINTTVKTVKLFGSCETLHLIHVKLLGRQ